MLPGRPLPEVVADILSLEGALLENSADGCLEFVAPRPLSRMLALPEHGKLVFAHQPCGPEVLYAGYDSEFFQAVANIFTSKGRLAMASYPGISVSPEKISALIREKIVLANGTFRLKDMETRLTTYLLGFFKYAALSDEKREGLFVLLAHGLNGAVSSPGENLSRILPELTESNPKFLPPAPEIERALQAACAAAPVFAATDLAPYIKSVDRRLNRDGKRVFEYYEALKSETQRGMERKAVGGEDSPDKNRDKLEAIESEKKWKIQDLVSKYSMNIRIELIAAVGISTFSTFNCIEIRRRLSSRTYPVTFNPLIRNLDPLPCESCYYPRGGLHLCDEKLHILCAACLQKCPQCAKTFCPVCHKKGCPRCTKGKPKI